MEQGGGLRHERLTTQTLVHPSLNSIITDIDNRANIPKQKTKYPVN